LLEILTPEKVFRIIILEVDNLLMAFEIRDKDTDAVKVQKEAQEKLDIFRGEIKNSLSQLDKNSEWNTFTIAFYGETNAGKSTLIETLRILLAEPKKMEERRNFEHLQKEFYETKCKIEEKSKILESIAFEYKDKIQGIENELQRISRQLEKEKKELFSLEGEHEKNLAHIESQLQNVFNLLQTKTIKESKLKKQKKIAGVLILLSNISFIRKYADRYTKELAIKESEFLKTNGLHTELTVSREKLINDYTKDANIKKCEILKTTELQTGLEITKEKLTYDFDMKTSEANNDLEQFVNKKKYLTEQIPRFIDGKIIGDGRSDFTSDVTEYTFEANNQNFLLLDLPGIEGNEKVVLDNINIAVQKAHAVFYITCKATPPQTGDKNIEGTLEKIKKHLGQQTEVYSIFNKRIKNPNSLKEKLIDEDETESLKILDKVMQSQLGEQYKKSISLSAYPAFLSVANCWQDEHEARKNKFFEHFSSSEAILKKTEFSEFSSWLKQDIVIDSKEKIKKSNYKKAVKVLEKAIEEIKQINDNYSAFQQDLIKNKKATDAQLDKSVEILNSSFNREAHNTVGNFKRYVRDSIYRDIEIGVNKEELKEKLEKHTKEGINKLQQELENKIKGLINEFKKDTENIVIKYQKYAEELLSAYNQADKFNKKIELNINIKDKNITGEVISSIGAVVGGVLSVVFFVSNPVGWIVLIGSGLIFIWNLIKMIRALFDDEYRKSQQRKAVDENMVKVESNIMTSIKENLKEADRVLRSGIENIKCEMMNTIDRVKIMNKILLNAKSSLTKLAKDVKKEGGIFYGNN